MLRRAIAGRMLGCVIDTTSVVAIVLSLTFVTVPSASAQDDWGMTRQPGEGATKTSRPASRPRQPRVAPTHPGEPDSRVLIERYLTVLATDADQPFALQRLLELYRQRDGNLDQLVVDLTERVELGRSAYAYLVVLGDVERARNQTDNARAAYERAIALAPNRPTALSALAVLEIDQGNADSARGLLERAVAASARGEPRRQLIRKLAELSLSANDFEQAARHFALLSEGGGIYLAAEYARALTTKGEHERAVAEYKRVLARLRGDPRVLAPLLVELAKAQLQASDVDGAIDTLGEARKVVGASGLGAEIDETLLDAYRRAGRLPELATQLERRAKGPDEQSLLGRVWDETGDSERALAAYRRALSLRPNSIDLRVRVIALLSRDGRLEDVISEYRALVRSAPREPRFVIELAQLLMETGQRSEALSLLARTGAQHPRDARLHEALARLYTRWNEDERAAAELTLLTRIAPDDPMHLVVLGEQQIAEGDREAALATWRRILRVSDSPAKARVMLGELMVDHDMLPEAIVEYREALKLEPNDVAASRGLAETLERSRREQEATVQWLRVIELAGEDRAMRREARRRLIAIWSRTNQLRDRLTQYARKFSITGDAQATDTDAGRFLAEGYERLARERAPQAAHFRELSERVLRRIIEIEPGDTESLTALEQALAARGDLDGAIAMLERLLLADPPRARAYLARMASYALQLYRDDQAIAYAERSVALNSDDAEAHQRLGELYRAGQQVEPAIAAFERAVKLNDRLFDVYFALADLHLARGHTADADRHLRHVMRACPDDELVARATRASIQLHLGDASLETLEAELLPLALGHPQRPIFRRLVIELYDALALPSGATTGAEDSTRAALAKRAIKPLLEALSDQDPEQRRAAVRILTQLHHPNAAMPLLVLAESDAEMDLRRAALLSAGMVATDELAPRFLAIAQGSHRRLRDVAAWALARMGTRGALMELSRLLDSSLPVARVYAVLGLGASGDARWNVPIGNLLRADRSPSVRAAAALALAKLGGPDAVAALTASMRGHDDQVATTAVVALGVLGDIQAAPVLADALFSPQRQLQAHAMWALSQLGHKSELSAAQLVTPPSLHGDAELWSPDLTGTDWSLLNGFAQRFPDALQQALRNALSGPRETLRATLRALSDPLTAETLPTHKTPLATLLMSLDEAFTKLASHPDRDVRAESLNVLSRIDSPSAAALLDAALRDPEQVVRASALRLIRETPRQDLADRVPQLVQLSRQSPAWSMRLRAIDALGKVGGADACAALIHALTMDDYAYVREQAARWVGERCRTEGASALSKARHADAEPRVRAAAATARAPR